jgi:hypothetical protein
MRYTLPQEAVSLLFRDLRSILSSGLPEAPQRAMRRLTLFEQMHVEDSLMSNPGKKIVMLADGDVPYVADELQEDGRLHVMQEHRYAKLDRAAMTLEYNKVTIDLSEIVYEGESWPDGIGDVTYDNICNYFFGET